MAAFRCFAGLKVMLFHASMKRMTFWPLHHSIQAKRNENNGKKEFQPHRWKEFADLALWQWPDKFRHHRRLQEMTHRSIADIDALQYYRSWLLDLWEDCIIGWSRSTILWNDLKLNSDRGNNIKGIGNCETSSQSWFQQGRKPAELDF